MHQAAQRIVLVLRLVIVGVCHGEQLPDGIVSVRRGIAKRVDDLFQAIGVIVHIARRVPQWIGHAYPATRCIIVILDRASIRCAVGSGRAAQSPHCIIFTVCHVSRFVDLVHQPPGAVIDPFTSRAVSIGGQHQTVTSIVVILRDVAHGIFHRDPPSHLVIGIRRHMPQRVGSG